MVTDPKDVRRKFIHLKCPRCGAKSDRDGFKVRGQWCHCGWDRSHEMWGKRDDD